MILNHNLEQIFQLAFCASPREAEYYAMKILVSLPSEYIIPGRKGRTEYELDEPDEVRDNLERQDLEKLISRCRLLVQEK